MGGLMQIESRKWKLWPERASSRCSVHFPEPWHTLLWDMVAGRLGLWNSCGISSVKRHNFNMLLLFLTIRPKSIKNLDTSHNVLLTWVAGGQTLPVLHQGSWTSVGKLSQKQCRSPGEWLWSCPLLSLFNQIMSFLRIPLVSVCYSLFLIFCSRNCLWTDTLIPGIPDCSPHLQP